MDLSTLADHELVSEASRGREQAYRELVERYERPVFSLVYRMVRDRSTAEDLAQEAFLRAFQALERYDPNYKFSSWLFKVANNLTIDYLRKRRIETVSIHGSPHAESPEEQRRTRVTLESREESPEAFTENRELGGQIERAIATLRPEYRTAILLRHVEGYGYEEIAEIMEVPLGTAKTYIHRGRAELKEALTEAVT